MTILIELILLILIVYLYKENISNKKTLKFLKNQIKTNRDNIKDSFKQISNLLEIYGKTIKLIQKLKGHLSKELSNITHDIGDLYRFTAKESETINKVMKIHNDFVDSTINSFKDIYCDLNDCDCSICSYHDYCSESSDNEETEFYNSDINDKDLLQEIENIPKESDKEISIVCDKKDNRFVIDPSNNNSFIKLKKVMAESGVPQEVIDNYIDYIKGVCKDFSSLIKNKTIEIAWEFKGNNKGGLIKHRFIKDKNIDDNLVDPNSKIVKTLNKLYEKTDE